MRTPATNSVVTGGAQGDAFHTSRLGHSPAWHALHDRGAAQAGECLLVLGASGGVGLAAVQVAKALGARVIAAASSQEKLDVRRLYGADETIDYTYECRATVTR